jgi:small-conductance mechanosensitive channel
VSTNTRLFVTLHPPLACFLSYTLDKMFSAPNTSGSDTTAIDMAELGQSSKKSFTNVTVNSVPPSERPVLGRRKTSGNVTAAANTDQKFSYDGEEDALTKVGNILWKIHNASILTRYILYILPVAVLLAIPLILTATIYRKKRAQGIHLLALFIWIEVIWVGLWVCKLVASALPVVFQAVCGVISTGIRKYSLVLMALEIPMSLFLWTIVAYGTSHMICMFEPHQCPGTWVITLEKVFMAGIIVAAIFLAEKTFVQLVSINYHRKQYDEKIKESKKLIRLLDMLYDASRSLFPEYCREFQEEDADIQGNTLTDVRKQLAQAGIRTKVFNDMGRVRDKVTAAFGAMASDITGKQVFSATSAHSIVVEALETERASKALARRLWLSFVGEGKDVLYQHDLVEVLGQEREGEAEEIFHLLDKDGNGDVSLEEMTLLVISVGQERKNRAASMHDISQAIAVLDRLLSVVVLAAIAFVYAAVFSPTFQAKSTTLWSTFTGLAFAIGGTVTEFLSCCIFLFIKHPYDVGDRVDINNVELIVERISLMYSVFRRVDSNTSIQLPHNIANTLWIENVSRSGSMKERISICVSAATTMEDVLTLRSELMKFVSAPENRRDYQPDLDVELRNLNDLTKLELRVEIRHKSNFSNEHLRNLRRNKFMVELLAASRRIPIEPPGGAAPPLGDPANPSYSVAVHTEEAEMAKAKHAGDATAARLLPDGSAIREYFPESMSSGVFNPAAAMIAGLAGRRNGSAAEGRRSIDDILPKRS